MSLASQINTDALVIDIDNFVQPHRIILWRKFGIVLRNGMTKKEYDRMISEIEYDVSEELFYYP